MSKTKSSAKPHYELLFIVSNKYSEEEAKAVVERAHKVITDNGGEVTYTEVWGKKKMTYQIRNFHYGYYFLAEFDCAKEKVNKINTEFRLSNEILRHMIVVKPIRTIEEIKAEKAKEEKKIIEKIKEEKKEIAEPKKPKDQKVDMKELDEKLDKILETDDLL